jgi:muconolactone delta-isomerase
MKFLVIWQIELSLLSTQLAAAVARMPAYAQPLERTGKVIGRYHMVGRHGGAWIYDVESNEELERLIGSAPVYNFAHYDVYPLAEMTDPRAGGTVPAESATAATGPGR